MAEPTDKEPNQFKNERIELTVTESADCRVEFELNVLPVECHETYRKAVQEVRKRVDLPGFRKGRVPLAMVEAQFGAAIEERWRDLTAQAAFRQAVQLCDIYPWSLEQVAPAEIATLSRDAGGSLTFRFEREPAVPSVSREQLTLQSKEVSEPSSDEVAKRLADYREHHSSFKAVPDKAITDGDHTRLDLFELGHEPPKAVVEDRRISVKEEGLPPWLYRTLQGMKASDTVDTQTELDPKASKEEQEAFEPTPVRVAVREVEEMVPPTDEELVQAFDVESIEQLEERIQQQLQKKAEGQADARQREQLWQQLINSFPFDLPATLLEQEQRRLVRVMVSQMRGQQSEESIITKEKEIEAAAMTEAIANLKKFFIARKIASEGKLEPDEQEIVARTAQFMIYDQLPEPQSEAERKQRWQAYRNQAYYQLIVRKAEDALLLEELDQA